MLDEIIDKGLTKRMIVPHSFLSRTWVGFKQTAKATVNLGGGPNNWGAKAAGGAIGLSTTIYYGEKYLDQGAEANKITKETVDAQNRATDAQEKANEIAERQLKESKELMPESNHHAARGADAALEYNKIAKEQNESVLDIDYKNELFTI